MDPTEQKVHLSPVCVSVASHGSLISAKYTSTSKQTAAFPSAKHKPLRLIWRVCSLLFRFRDSGLIVCIYVIICKCWVLLLLLSSSLDSFKEQKQNWQRLLDRGSSCINNDFFFFFLHPLSVYSLASMADCVESQLHVHTLKSKSSSAIATVT